MTLLISSLIGLISGLVPAILNYLTARANAAQQLALAELQLRYHQAELELKGDIAAFQAILVAPPVGNAWIDGWNALVRPITISFLLGIFILTAAAYLNSLAGQVWRGDISAATAAGIIWDDKLIGGSIQAALGWVFGYRAATKGVR